MSKIKFKPLIKTIRSGLAKHSPAILTAFGITGMIGTTVLAVKATPKALDLIENKKEELDKDGLTVVETVKATWKCYVPAAITCATSAACLIGASSVHTKRNAALATAYKLSESALIEYRDKVVETIGEKKEQSVRDAIAKDHVEKNPVTNNEVIITDRGYTLCYDELSGRYFYSDIEKIKKAANELNRQMLNDMYVSLNELYYELGLDGTKLGEQMGWNIDRGLIDLKFSATVSADDRPCIVLDYRVPPMYDYQNMR